MSSHQRQVAEIERESVRARINLYKQMKEQLHSQMKLYQGQRKEELAKLIFESIQLVRSNNDLNSSVSFVS
jgi:hypothetical protein